MSSSKKGLIEVVLAGFGANCGTGNLWLDNEKATLHAANVCNGKGVVDYRISISDIGDPAHGCDKQYYVLYRCDVDGYTAFYKTEQHCSEADGHVVTLRADDEPKLSAVRLYPDWMWGRMKILGPKRLLDVRMPGTHDAGTYTIESSVPKAECYAVTQTKGININVQLTGGVRYLDLRAGDFRDYRDMRVAHTIPGTPILGLLMEIWQFHRDHPYEVLIIDMRQENNHQLLPYMKVQLQNWFQQLFGKEAIVRNPDETVAGLGKPLSEVTMNDLWNIKKTILILWDKDISQVNPASIFWPEQDYLFSEYADSEDPDKVFEKLDKCFDEAQKGRKYFNKPYAAQIVMTPQRVPFSSCINDMAAFIRPRASGWLKSPDKAKGRLNIVLLDYIFEPLEQAGLVEQIIESNK